MLQQNCTAFLTPEKKQPNIRIAYQHHISNKNNSPYILFLHGLMSDMNGSKALFLKELCAEQQLNYLAFDNLGHGESSGEFTNQTIGSWLECAEIMLEQISQPVIIVGSSMGAWIALLLARQPQLHHKIMGLVTLAAAPDFTETIWGYITPGQQNQLKHEGVMLLPNKDGSHHFPISYQLITEARNHLLKTQKSIHIQCPSHLIHGIKDTEVSFHNSELLLSLISSNNIKCTLLEEATHRLSDPTSLKCLRNAILDILESSA